MLKANHDERIQYNHRWEHTMVMVILARGAITFVVRKTAEMGHNSRSVWERQAKEKNESLLKALVHSLKI